MKPMLFNTDMVKAIQAGKKTVTRRVIKPQPRQEEENPHRLHSGSWFFDIPSRRFPGALYASVGPYWPPCQPGDVLYVRETWAFDTGDDGDEIGTGYFAYKADDLHHPDCKWRPSIHMPKEAARIFLRVKDVRVERLQDITAEQAIREGISRMFDHLSDEEYRQWVDRVAPGKKKTDWGWDNYLWHGHFGSYGMGNKLSDAWPYQYSGYDEPVGSFSSLWNRTLLLKDWPTYGWDANPWVWVIEFEPCERPDVDKAAEK